VGLLTTEQPRAFPWPSNWRAVSVFPYALGGTSVRQLSSMEAPALCRRGLGRALVRARGRRGWQARAVTH